MRSAKARKGGPALRCGFMLGGESSGLRSTQMTCPACQRENPLENAFCGGCGARLSRAVSPVLPSQPASPLPSSFGGGRYRVQRFLGEGSRKTVYLAHDTRLDR